MKKKAYGSEERSKFAPQSDRRVRTLIAIQSKASSQSAQVGSGSGLGAGGSGGGGKGK